MAYHADDVAKTLGKVLDDIPTSALKPSTVTNAGRNLVESGSKSAGRVGGSSVDELATASLVSKSGNGADHGATFAGKSSSVSRNADEGMDYGKQAVAKSPSKPVDSKVTDLSEYKAKKAEVSKPAEAVEENLNFGKSANNNVQSMDMAERMGSKSSNVVSMDVQAKAPIRGMEEATQLKKVSGSEGIDYDAIGLPKQKQLDLVVNNEFSSMKNGSEFVASAGGRMDSPVNGMPSASGASRGTSGAGKIGTEVDEVGKWTSKKGIYSVGYEVNLPKDMYPNVSSPRHFQEANKQLYEAFQKDPRFAQQMEEIFPGINKGVEPGARGSFSRNRPTKDVTWHHHPGREGVLQLVPVSQHKASGPIQKILHPDKRGGMENWGGGR